MLNPVLTMTASSPSTRNVILIGFMGTGKTSIGRRVAQSLGFDFVDTDERIIEKAGMPITEIFAEQGEEKFRDLESTVLRSTTARKNQVISTGGGVVLREENREVLARSGYVIWLNASPEAILERVSRNQERPLLQAADPLGTIREMLKQREPLYLATADFTIDTDGLSPDETAFGICESARVIFGT